MRGDYLTDIQSGFIEALKGLGLYDNSLIIVTSDHGEGMGEHDYFFAHGEYVYNSLIHVPLIVRFGEDTAGCQRETSVVPRDFVKRIDRDTGRRTTHKWQRDEVV